MNLFKTTYLDANLSKIGDLFTRNDSFSIFMFENLKEFISCTEYQIYLSDETFKINVGLLLFSICASI
jgi:hypothetical protein